MPRPGPNVTSDADTQPGSDSLFPTGFSGGGALVRSGSVGTGEIADGSVASADLNLASVATALAARGEFTGTYAQVVGLPASNSTDDTATLNALLATASGKRVRGLHGQNYQITAPLVLPAGGNVELDMTGCTVTLKAGSGGNMLQNAAVNTATRVLDIAMTASSAALSSATIAALGTSAVNALVGQAITVQGAGTSGAPFTTTVSAVTGSLGTYGLTLAAAASTTVTGQYASIGVRDSNIAVVGGKWDRQNNNGTPTNGVNAHTLRFRHVDGLTVRGVYCVATGGKYSINPGDCTRVRVLDCDIQSSSDGVHLNGPCSDVVVRNIKGYANLGDDLVSMTARDSVSAITDCAGDITDVLVDGAYYPSANASLFASVLKVVAGKTTDASANLSVKRITARSLIGPDTTAAVAYVGDTSGGNLDDILIEDVRSLGGSSKGCVDIHGGTTVDRITLRNLVPDPADTYAVSVNASVTRLDVSGIKTTASTGQPIGVTVANGCTVGQLLIDRAQMAAPAGSSLLRINSGGAVTQAIVTAATLSGPRLANCPSGTGTLGYLSVNGLATSGTDYPLGVFSNTTSVSLNGANSTGMTAWLWVQGSGQVTVTGASGVVGDADTYLGNVLVSSRSSSVLNSDPNALAAGDETVPRLFSTSSFATSSGNLLLTYFTARRSETVTQVRTITGGTAAASATLCRIGLYAVDSSGNLTLVASTANDTTLWAGTFTSYTRSFSASYAKVAGQRYALAVLFTGTTPPKWDGLTPVSGAEGAISPRINGAVASQSDLPASITAGTVSSFAGISVYATVIP